jgi:hypothetical protein
LKHGGEHEKGHGERGSHKSHPSVGFNRHYFFSFS